LTHQTALESFQLFKQHSAKVHVKREGKMAAMRYQGRLRKWNVERGYGFILASDSGQDVFVHISAFPRDGRAPLEGDELTFEVEPTGNGKKHAVRVQRLGVVPPARAFTPNPRPNARPSARPLSRAPQTASLGSKVIGLVLLAALGWYGYSRYDKQVAQIKALAPAPAAQVEPVQSAPGAFNCDGRKYCSQMTSCTEAKLFLKNCPGMEMDGNHNGVPCEQQWCTSP
jgi:cold shock CspA family protein